MHALIAVITLAALWVWAVAHQLVLGWLFAVAVDQMPAPQKAYGFYAWVFGFLQVLAANVKRGGKGVAGTLGAGQQSKA